MRPPRRGWRRPWRRRPISGLASARSMVATSRPPCMTSTRSLMPSTSGSSLEIIRIAMPSCARRPISAWISALAPTSMPRVGSSMIRMRGSVSSHLPSTTFCWLPPESWPTTCSGPRARMPSCLIEAAARCASAAEVDEDAAGDAAQRRHRDVLADGHRPDQALQAAVLGHVGDAEVAGLARRGDGDRAAVELDRAGGRRGDAEDRQRELGAAGADEAGEAEDLAAAELEGDVAHPVAEGRGPRP